jgi:hypothetical protein
MRTLFAVLLAVLTSLSVYAQPVPQKPRAVVNNGTSSYLVNTAPTNANATHVLIMAWIKPAATTQGVIVGNYKQAAGGRSYSIVSELGSAVKLYVSGDGTAAVTRTSATAPMINRWSLVAATYEPGAMLTYVNGVLDTGALSGAAPASLHQPASPNLSVGAWATPSTYFQGQIGPVIVISYAALPANIKDIIAEAYARGARGFQVTYPNGVVIAHYRWGAGGFDQSPNRNHLTATNTPVFIYR